MLALDYSLLVISSYKPGCHLHNQGKTFVMVDYVPHVLNSYQMVAGMALFHGYITSCRWIREAESLASSVAFCFQNYSPCCERKSGYPGHLTETKGPAALVQICSVVHFVVGKFRC